MAVWAVILTALCIVQMNYHFSVKKAVDCFIFSVLKLKTTMLHMSWTESECHEELTADKMWSSFCEYHRAVWSTSFMWHYFLAVC